jgi:hypothetical protein
MYRISSLFVRFFKIIVLKRRGHAIDLVFADALPGGFVPPCRDSLTDLGDDGFRFLLVQIEISGDAHCQVEGSCAVVLVDGGGENARPNIDGHGVQIVGRRESPAFLPGIEDTVIAQVIVRVRN